MLRLWSCSWNELPCKGDHPADRDGPVQKQDRPEGGRRSNRPEAGVASGVCLSEGRASLRRAANSTSAGEAQSQVIRMSGAFAVFTGTRPCLRFASFPNRKPETPPQQKPLESRSASVLTSRVRLGTPCHFQTLMEQPTKPCPGLPIFGFRHIVMTRFCLGIQVRTASAVSPRELWSRQVPRVLPQSRVFNRRMILRASKRRKSLAPSSPRSLGLSECGF